jgi:hypothetical protein
MLAENRRGQLKLRDIIPRRAAIPLGAMESDILVIVK